MLNRLLIIITILFTGFSSQANDTDLFEQGNKAYEEGNFNLAIELYDSIIAQNLESKELYYNLGNSYYKNREYPKAILNYEKALKLNPGDEETIHNLNLAKARISDEQPEEESVRLSDWIFKNTPLSSNTWAWFAILIFILSFTSLIYFVLAKKSVFKKITFYSGVALLIIGGISIYLSALHYHKVIDESKAIILEPSIEIMTEPTENASVAFILHEGSKVTILQENKEWFEIKFSNGKIGWLEKSKVATI